MSNPINLRAAQLPGGGFKRMWAPDLTRKFWLVAPDFPEIVPRGPFRLISATKRAGAILRPGGECVEQIGGMEVWRTLLVNEIAYIDPLVIDPKKMSKFVQNGANIDLLRDQGLKVRSGDYSPSEVLNAVCGRMMEPTDENYYRVFTAEEIIAQHDGPSHEELVKELPLVLGRAFPRKEYPMLADFMGFVYARYAAEEDLVDEDVIRGYIAQYPAQCNKFMLGRATEDLYGFFVQAFIRGNDDVGFELVPQPVADRVCQMIRDLYKG